ncbi:hypothetical protein V6N13_039992 [Hibiscus sabdariffa]|uniref:Uncharacterized protein n=1 Tax=Hibiscus sabdariffa TaxID=183260 RepID=A0ABR2SUP6_9ROSI
MKMPQRSLVQMMGTSTTAIVNHQSSAGPGSMASEAPSWADQWGTGGIGAMDAEKPKGKGGFKAAEKFKLGVSKGLNVRKRVPLNEH